MSLKTYPYDTAEFLDDDQNVAHFAEAVLEEGDPLTFRRALDVIARAHGFAHLAEKVGISRRKLVEALRDPESDQYRLLRAVLVAESERVEREAAE